MFRRALCWTVIASIALMVNPGAAHGSGEVGLSLDGRTWTSELQRPLFEPGLRWVPGDTEVRSLWVRNQGPSGASTRIAVRTADPDGMLGRDGITIAARAGGGAWVPLAAADAGSTLSNGVVAEGEQLRVDVRVAFEPTATSMTEVGELPLRFVVRLTEAAPGGGDDGSGPGDLPDTGATVTRWLVWLAAGMIGAGLLILARRRVDCDG